MDATLPYKIGVNYEKCYIFQFKSNESNDC